MKVEEVGDSGVKEEVDVGEREEVVEGDFNVSQRLNTFKKVPSCGPSCPLRRGRAQVSLSNAPTPS